MASPLPAPIALLVLAGLALLLAAALPTQAADRVDDPVPWGIEAMHDAPSLPRTSGGEGVDVVVLDTGVDVEHPDLVQRVERCRNYTAEEVRRGSCNDVDGHGTHVAGTVAADGGQDGEGIWGMAPEADVWAFKVCEDDGSCRTDRIGKAVRDAARLGAEVLVISLGGQPEPFVQDALNASLEQDALPVAAAGNAGPNLSTIKYPAADRLSVAVGALGRLERGQGHDVDNLAVPDFSSRGDPAEAFREGDNLTELGGPGFGVRSTATGGGYSRLSGTSMAAPHVAGLAAKLWTVVGDADGDGKVRDDVRASLRERAAAGDVTQGEHARGGYDPASGIGIPRLQGPVARIDGPAAVLVGEEASFHASAEGPDPIASYEWDLDGDGTFERTGQTQSVSSTTVGSRTIAVRVTDETGSTARDQTKLKVHRPPRPSFQVEPPVPVADEVATLDGTSSRDPDGDPIASHRWSVGDAARYEGSTVDLRFDETGPVDVTLTVVDGDGAANETTRSILVNDRPGIRLELPDDAVAGEAVRLRALVEDAVGSHEVTWRFPDGSQATGGTVERAFPAGTHPISATAEDEHGARGTATGALQVREPDEGDEAPGPGLVGALAAGVVAGLAVRFRR